MSHRPGLHPKFRRPLIKDHAFVRCFVTNPKDCATGRIDLCHYHKGRGAGRCDEPKEAHEVK